MAVFLAFAEALAPTDGSELGAGFVMANYDGKSKNKSLIKENVFVGSNTTIISPVIIHSDSIIGAGSVVTKDVLSAEVVVGNPARKLRK